MHESAQILLLAWRPLEQGNDMEFSPHLQVKDVIKTDLKSNPSPFFSPVHGTFIPPGRDLTCDTFPLSYNKTLLFPSLYPHVLLGFFLIRHRDQELLNRDTFTINSMTANISEPKDEFI
jgi:hypothetical protein